MGKLHTLRRAIERNPRNWVDSKAVWETGNTDKVDEIMESFLNNFKYKQIVFDKVASGARQTENGSWKPSQISSYYNPLSYQKFVQRVLEDLNIMPR